MDEKIEIHWMVTFREPQYDGLRSLLADRFVLTMGEEIPEGARPHVLITGFPPRDHLERNDRLQAMIIPFAGVPGGTRRVLADFPDLPIHNIHHNAVAVAEMTMTLYLAASKRLLPIDNTMREGNWQPRYLDEATRSVSAYRSTALILGYGAIGREVAKRCQAFGMRVMATRFTVTEPETDELGTEVYPADALYDLLPQTDALFIALPLTPETGGLIGEEELALLHEQAVVVNVGRGPVIDQEALYEALKEKRIYGAGIDVWYHYPSSPEERFNTPPADYPFHELDNIVMSPHRASNTSYTEVARYEYLAKVLNPLAEGKPMPNRIDMGKGY